MTCRWCGRAQAKQQCRLSPPRGHRAHLRARGITAIVPEPADQAGHRTRRGSLGGRPVGYDTQNYKQRDVVERAFNRLKQWRGIAIRYDKHALVYRGAVVLLLASMISEPVLKLLMTEVPGSVASRRGLHYHSSRLLATGNALWPRA